MIAVVVAIVCFFIGVGIGSYISGHVAYEEGVNDERKGWYIHAECHHWKEEDFKRSDEYYRRKAEAIKTKEDYLESIWHDASMTPYDGAQILVRYGKMNNSVYSGKFVSLKMDFNDKYIYQLISKVGAISVYTRQWAYVNDVIPEKDNITV